jgi:hypothetical protein
VQAVKLLALVLAIVLSPRIATADVVAPIDHGVESAASESSVVEPCQTAPESGAPTTSVTVSEDSDEGQSGAARASAPRSKKRWGSLRRIPLLRRPAARVIGRLAGDDVASPAFDQELLELVGRQRPGEEIALPEVAAQSA